MAVAIAKESAGGEIWHFKFKSPLIQCVGVLDVLCF